jgi:hypothetical protein
VTRRNFKATKAYLEAHGIPQDSVELLRPDRLWLSQEMPEASVPLIYAPPNATSTGPIILPDQPVVEKDPELASWLARAPTVLVNLGSLFAYSEAYATKMALAIRDLLAQTDVQVLWKMAKEDNYPDANYMLPVKDDVEKGRLRITEWLTVSPVSLMETGHIVASVHHGGANCYHEAIAYVFTRISYSVVLRCLSVR